MRTTLFSLRFRTSSFAFAICLASPVLAQERPPKPTTSANVPADQTAATDENQDITVTGWRLRELDKATSTASRLGLTIRETPATIDQIGADVEFAKTVLVK